MCLTSCCRQTSKVKNLKFGLLEMRLNFLNNAINRLIICKEPIKMYDNNQCFVFIGGTLNYVTYVTS